MDKIFLNIGCGNCKLDGFINIDLEPTADMQLDIRNGLPFDDDSVNGIYSEHFIEHLDQGEGIAFLRECRRVLKYDGTLRISTPDLNNSVQRYINNDWREKTNLDRYGFGWLNNSCEYLNTAMREWGHKWLYDETELFRLIKYAGFHQVNRCERGISKSLPLFNNLESRIGNFLIIEATKRKRKEKVEKPLVSIIIPAYNYKYFSDALKSALKQSYANIEIIIGDDSHSEEIKDIVEILKKEYPSKKVLYFREGAPGLGERNNFITCLSKSKGELIKPLYDDDILEPQCVERMVDYIYTHPSVTLVTSYRQLIDAEGHKLPDNNATKRIFQKDSLINGSATVKALVTDNINFIGEPSTVMFRKEDLIDEYPDILSFAGRKPVFNGDVSIWMKLLSRGDCIYIEESLSRFRQHKEQSQKKPGILDKASLAWEHALFDAKRMGFLSSSVPQFSGRPLNEKFFQEVLENDPDAPRTLHQYAILQYSKGKTDEAIVLLEKSLRGDPDNAEIMNDLGTMYYSTGEKDRAITLFNKAIDTDPNMFAARVNLADLYTESGQFERAEPIYQKILRMNPDNIEALGCLAGLYKTMGRIDEVSACLDRISKIENSLLLAGNTPASNVENVRINTAEVNDHMNGVCNICGSREGFLLTNPENPRESWVCLSCGSTSRDRMYIYALSKAFGNSTPLIKWTENSSIHILEAAGARAHPGILKAKFSYLNTQYDPDKMTDLGYDRNRFADLQALHFDNDSFDVVMSSDVFEHIRLYKKALKEIFRVLKPGGTMVLQAPFHTENNENIVRVRPEGDEDIFLCPPTYHDEDTLVYRVFGAEFITEIESEGFAVEVIEDGFPLHCITLQNVILAKKPENYHVRDGESRAKFTNTASYRGLSMKYKEIKKGKEHMKNDLENESDWMKRDWNKRAEENARYYIHSTEMDQSEEDFDASGKQNVQSLVIDDLQTITGGADPKTLVALEIGCGLGRMTRHFADIFKEIHGVDVSGEMIRQAKSRLEYLPNAYCYETSGTDLSIFTDGMFDFVFSFIVFQHIPSKEVILNYLREAHRVLKTGGVFKFQVQGCTDPHWMKMEKDTWHGVTITEEDIDDISQELGFDLVAKSGQGTQYSWFTLKKSGMIAKPKEPLLASIIIPVYNQLEYTRQCLDALGKNTPKDLYELIVVDNNSTDGSNEYLSKITGNVKIITNKENMGFTIACNQGAKAAQGRYLVFLNNDTIPLDGWLTSLLDTFKLGDDIGAVGSKLIYPDTRLQEAGGIIFSDGNGWNFGRGDSPDFGRYNKLIEVDYCSGASLAVRKDLFDELGGFDEIYAPAYYEDTDLCFSLREKGYRILYQPESEIIHCEGKTAGSDTGSGFKKYQVINHEKFIKKWEHRLKDQGPSPYKGAPKPFTADRKRRLAGYTHNNKINNFVNSVTTDSAETINFLIIDPFLPIYDKASGSFRLFQIVKILANTPHVHITYLARHGHHGDKYIRLLTSMGVEVHHTDPEKLFSFDIFVQKFSLNMKYILAQKKYHYVYLSFYEIALQYLPEIRLYSPETKIVIDTVDIHFLREMRQAELYDDNDLMKKAHNTKDNELDIYQRADALITVTDQDADVIRPYFPQKPIYIIPNIHPVEKGKLSFQDRSGIIFIGNYYHPPNVDAVEYLLRDIHPKLRKKGLSIPIQIIGDGLPENVKKLGDKNVLFTGWVPETRPYLENAKISIAPLRYGAGMKGKVGEALAAGLPVITTSIGAEGMGLCHEKDVLIVDTADEFADAIIQLYKNESLWTTLQENGIEFIEKNYSITAVQKNVQEIFKLSEAQLHTEDTLPDEKSKITSIIIPCFNQLKYTKKCLESIFKHTRKNYELILVDNGSTDGTRNYFSKLSKDHEQVQIILNDKNLGFAAANNQGLEKAKGDYILLLNNDVVVTEGWLERLISHLEQFPDIGMVGPMSNSVSGDQLVENVPYKNKLNAMHKFAREFAKNNYGKVTEIMRIVGFCLLIKKEVLEVIGGLDENYGSGNFEDDDLCLRSYIAGYKNVIAGDVFIHHYGSMTFKGNSLDYMATMKKNLSYFGKKWKDIIEVHDTGYKIHLTKEQQIQKLICWGEEKYSSGDLRSAIKIFERVLRLDKRNSQALSNLGVIQWQLGKAISAIDTFQKAIFLDPKDHDALANLVQAVSELNRYDLIQNNLIDLLRQSQPANPDFKRLMEIQEPALNT